MYTLSEGNNSVEIVCLPFEKGFSLKRKNLLPFCFPLEENFLNLLRSRFFPFRVDPFFRKGLGYREAQRKS